MKNHVMGFLKSGLLITAICSCCLSPAFGQSMNRATLSVTATQGDVLDNAKNLVLAYCIANRLVIVGYDLSMSLQVAIGNSSVSFQKNGTKEVYVDATDQDYRVTGQSVVAFRAINQRFGTQSIRVVYSYAGDGIVRLGPGEANSTVWLTLRTTNSRVASMDMGSGQAEVEETVSLTR